MKLLCVFCFLLANHCAKTENGTACLTPNKENGTCLTITECPLLTKAVIKASTAEEKRFLRNSQCGWSSSWPKVCCGTRDVFTTPTREELKPPRVELKPARDKELEPRYKADKSYLLPDRTKCGFQNADKIIGGTVAGISEFPWTALLVYIDRNNKTSFKCGGVLINERYVLTSAHCQVRGLKRVRLGEWSLSKPVDCVGKGVATLCSEHVDVDIESVKVHEDYRFDKAGGLLNDLALIRLNQSVNYTRFIQPICLPTAERDIVGEDLWVTGWGVTNTETFATSDVKQKVMLKVISLPECRIKFKEKNRQPQVDDSHICAMGEGNKSSCLGDSGNPFVTTVSEEIEQFYVEGIVSYGGPLCNWMPVVFSRVYPYLDWIKDNVLP